MNADEKQKPTTEARRRGERSGHGKPKILPLITLIALIAADHPNPVYLRKSVLSVLSAVSFG
jgi:hypothetical protein